MSPREPEDDEAPPRGPGDDASDPVFAAITADLHGRRSARARRLVLGMIAVLAVIALLLAVMGVRGDLLARAPWRVASELLAWFVALGIVPPMAVGLWHPRRAFAVAFVAIAGALVAVAAVERGAHDPGVHATGCELIVAMVTVPVLVALGFAGAWSPARARGAAAWAAVATAMAGFVGVDWVCAQADLTHVALGHLAPALAGATVAGALGLARRR